MEIKPGSVKDKNRFMWKCKLQYIGCNTEIYGYNLTEKYVACLQPICVYNTGLNSAKQTSRYNLCKSGISVSLLVVFSLTVTPTKPGAGLTLQIVWNSSFSSS